MHFVYCNEIEPNLRLEMILLMLVETLYFANLPVGQVKLKKTCLRRLQLVSGKRAGVNFEPCYVIVMQQTMPKHSLTSAKNVNCDESEEDNRNTHKNQIN